MAVHAGGAVVGDLAQHGGHQRLPGAGETEQGHADGVGDGDPLGERMRMER